MKVNLNEIFNPRISGFHKKQTWLQRRVFRKQTSAFDNPPKNLMGHPFDHLSRSQKQIPWILHHPFKCSPCTELSPKKMIWIYIYIYNLKKSTRHVPPDKSGGTWSSTSTPSSKAKIRYSTCWCIKKNHWAPAKVGVFYRMMQEFFQCKCHHDAPDPWRSGQEEIKGCFWWILFQYEKQFRSIPKGWTTTLSLIIMEVKTGSLQ